MPWNRGTAGTWALVLGLTASAGEVTLVREGRPAATVIISQDASADVRDAAEVLIRYVEEASGARLPLAVAGALATDQGGTRVLVGVGQPDAPRDLLPAGLDDDGFVVIAEGNRVVIAGPADSGTAFGVYAVLERHVGVRWLLPGPDGTDVPARRTLVIPEGRVQDAPVFFSRLFSGLRGPEQAKWARFNRMHGRVSFHHNLIRLFPPETYTATHPEFFPMKDGQTRYLPASNTTHGWQPCFSASGLAEEAVRNILVHLKENPQVRSYSLGVNDSSGHCKCAQCAARVPEAKNFLGRADYSDLYFDWCNRVITGVLKERPDLWFGCLAYSEVAAPPTRVTVHPRMIPYMTYDRMKWIHSEVEAAGHAATEAWGKVSPALGWYDYIYGSPYCVPRVYFHQAASYLRYARDHGVRTHYAEIYPNFGEGPKPYLYLRLWWDPDQDVDALLSEWYERCVGPAAAGDLAAYYSLWEGFWTRDILQSKWFSVDGQYLAFSSPAYLADVPPDRVSESRRLLESCIAKCQTDRQRARARLLERAFQYYEASVLAYQSGRRAVDSPLDSEADVLAALDAAVQGLAMAQKRRDLVMTVFSSDPVLMHPIDLERHPQLTGTTWGGAGLWRLADWLSRGPGPVRQRIEDLAGRSDIPLLRDQATVLLAVADSKTERIGVNGSFEEGAAQGATAWSYWRKPDVAPEKPVGNISRSSEVAHSGAFSVLCEGLLRGGPVQTVALPGPGRYVVLGRVMVPPGQTAQGTVELNLTPLDDKGKNLPGCTSGRVIPQPGKWVLLTAGMTIAGGVEKAVPSKARVVPVVDGFQDGGRVFLDDVEIHRIRE